ncbi:hypothetical Protein YC6258_03022 [Gynuella sunshinyii YC6258]|uniref:Uncharacterized protein n=1 Tax=Gynuella sunshinyii YC6258 TaxID=1445510 RepID=A0A0C5V6H6_9GAMM|nr:hypothetical Protein YC6258_03022 [Gynuella sunshinyii YC6258]
MEMTKTDAFLFFHKINGLRLLTDLCSADWRLFFMGFL